MWGIHLICEDQGDLYIDLQKYTREDIYRVIMPFALSSQYIREAKEPYATTWLKKSALIPGRLHLQNTSPPVISTRYYPSHNTSPLDYTETSSPQHHPYSPKVPAQSAQNPTRNCRLSARMSQSH